MTDFTILSAPRIRRSTFARILHEAHSPAAHDADLAWAKIVAHGVDPAVELAMFQHESNYGRAGAAVTRRNWGNLRRSPNFPRDGGFVTYPTWAAGAGDTARLLAIYGHNKIRPPRNTSTALTFPFVWAPAADHNKPAAYGRAIVGRIREYRTKDAAWNPGGGPQVEAAVVHPATVPHGPPPAGVTRYRTSLRGCRIRTAPRLGTAIVKLAPVGLVIGVTGAIEGGTYTVNGVSSRTWLRVVEIGGVRLDRPAFSASLLWRRL